VILPAFRKLEPVRAWFVGAGLLALVAGAWVAIDYEPPRFLPADTGEFVAIFPPPPATGSAQERRELDELLALQRTRGATDVQAARDDRRKDVDRFYAALGLDPRQPPPLQKLRALMNDVEDDVSRYVRAPKRQFARNRPYVVEPAIQPCIGDVAGDRSYPSGHAAYGYVVAYLLADMAPERRDALVARADEFARARALCGVHFPSDLEAGRIGARWIADRLLASPDYRAAASAAAAELRAALANAQPAGHSSANRAPPSPVLLLTDTRPRCSAAILATIASPSPNPPVSRLRLVSSRVNAWNTEALCASGIPSPSSSTTSRHMPFSQATSMLTLRRA
jgi:acid phosphatase (class A)